jgi:GT2 family glycosyltransferase
VNRLVHGAEAVGRPLGRPEAAPFYTARRNIEARNAGGRSDSSPSHPLAATPSPTVTIIIAARPEDSKLAALESLAWWRPEVVEVLVARGEAPSAQRNAAARQASGDLLLFLDDDSEPSAGLIDVYLELFRRDPGCAAAGGPAVYRARSFRERLGAAVLSEPLVTGPSASRYLPRGGPRASDERELILSNLAVRRRAFEEAGGFDELLYPSEENLFLDRLRDRGAKVCYEPRAAVSRPAPQAGGALFAKVFRYGRGRSAQARRRLTRTSAARLSGAAMAFIVPLIGVAALRWTVVPLAALGASLALYSALASLRIRRREGPAVVLLAPAAALGTLAAYAAGILTGLFRRQPSRESEIRVERRLLSSRDGRGK